MLHSLKAIQSYKSGNTPEAQQQWLQLLAAAEKPHINLERIQSIAELEGTNPVLDYTERTLHVLEKLQVSFWVREILEEVLIWSETAKAGSREQRRAWQKQGVNLFVHNVGSAQLYDLYAGAEHLDNDIGKTKETGIDQPGSPSSALSNNADISEHDALNTQLQGMRLYVL